MSRILCVDASSDPSNKKKATRGRVKKRGLRVIPQEAKLVPGVFEDDYFSLVSGVYYHFKKMEWRAICKDPFNASKRSQKTFGINKYGFYEAKKRAESKAFEVSQRNQLSQILSRYNVCLIPEDTSLQDTYYADPRNVLRSPPFNTNPYFKFNNDRGGINFRGTNGAPFSIGIGTDTASKGNFHNFYGFNLQDRIVNNTCNSGKMNGSVGSMDLNETIVDLNFRNVVMNNGLNLSQNLDLNNSGASPKGNFLEGKNPL